MTNIPWELISHVLLCRHNLRQGPGSQSVCSLLKKYPSLDHLASTSHHHLISTAICNKAHRVGTSSCPPHSPHPLPPELDCLPSLASPLPRTGGFFLNPWCFPSDFAPVGCLHSPLSCLLTCFNILEKQKQQNKPNTFPLMRGTFLPDIWVPGHI